MFKHNWRLTTEIYTVLCSSCKGFKFSLFYQNNWTALQLNQQINHLLCQLAKSKYCQYQIIHQRISFLYTIPPLFHSWAEPEWCQSQKKKRVESEPTSKYKWFWKWPLVNIFIPPILPSKGITNHLLTTWAPLIFYIEDLNIQNIADFYKSIHSLL